MSSIALHWTKTTLYSSAVAEVGPLVAHHVAHDLHDDVDFHYAVDTFAPPPARPRRRPCTRGDLWIGPDERPVSLTSIGGSCSWLMNSMRLEIWSRNKATKRVQVLSWDILSYLSKDLAFNNRWPNCAINPTVFASVSGPELVSGPMTTTSRNCISMPLIILLLFSARTLHVV